MNDDIFSGFGNIAALQRRLQKSISEEDLKNINQQTYTYLQFDKQRLRERDEARKSKQYSYIKSFFYFQYQQKRSTRLVDITTEDIKAFLDRQRLSRQIKPPLSSYSKQPAGPRYYEKGALNAFFARAVEDGLISTNPVLPLTKVIPKLEPINLTAQNQTDYRNFEQYLQSRVENGLLSPRSASRIRGNFRILFHDIENYHMKNPDWPLELEAIFSHPRWLTEWLNDIQNRSGSEHKQLTRGSVKLRFNTIYHVWLFLLADQRTSASFYDDLKNRFKIPGNKAMVLLRGRRTKIIRSLSEDEEKAVFDCIKRYSRNNKLMLRDLAMFVTSLQTAIRLDGLNNMRIENFRQLEPDVWVCNVPIKRKPEKTIKALDKLNDNNEVWDDWYISPQTRAAIDKYLKATSRNWDSRGPVWLSHTKAPLLSGGQSAAIRKWLKFAGCNHDNVHALRHTATVRLLINHKCAIPDVQAITQHSSLQVLLDIYGKRQQIESFRAVNRLYPAETKTEIEMKDVVLSVATNLGQVSAEILQKYQQDEVILKEYARELLDSLRQRIKFLAKALDLDLESEVFVLPRQDYDKLYYVLQSFNVSVFDMLGYEPRLETLPIINIGTQKPASLLGKENQTERDTGSKPKKFIRTQE